MSRPDLKGIDPADADIRLVGLFAPGTAPIVWYSYKKFNGGAQDKIIEGMHKRFLEYAQKQRLIDKLQCLQYYNNRTNELLKEFKS